MKPDRRLDALDDLIEQIIIDAYGEDEQVIDDIRAKWTWEIRRDK